MILVVDAVVPICIEAMLDEIVMAHRGNIRIRERAALKATRLSLSIQIWVHHMWDIWAVRDEMDS